MVGALEAYNVQFAVDFYGGKDSLYNDSCKQVEEVFGCIGLQNQKFTIFNKQYDEAEYKELKHRLIEHMKETGEWGEFFPVETAPFAYNETAAQDLFPMKQAEVEANGWQWREPEEREIKYSAYRMMDSIESVKDDLTSNFLTCESCKKNYRVIQRELNFYREQTIPIPRECFDCRHLERLSQHNPRALWHRQCMCTQPDHDHRGQCPTEFETSYSQKNPAMVYCEPCYEKAIN